MLDRATIESTLQQLRSGEISPDQATRLLLQSDLQNLPESLSSMVDRIGFPPTQVVNHWCDQLRAIAVDCEAKTGRPITSIDLDLCHVTGDGRLVWDNRTSPHEAPPSDQCNLSAESESKIESFRESLVSARSCDPPDGTSNQGDSALVLEASPSMGNDLGNNDLGNNDLGNNDPSDHELDRVRSQAIDQAESETRQPDNVGSADGLAGRRLRSVLFVAGLLVCIVTAGYVMVRATRETQTTADAKRSTGIAPAIGMSDSSPVPDAASTDPMDGVSNASIADLETLESMTDAELSSLESSGANALPALSLDAFMPKMSTLVPEDGIESEADESDAAESSSDGGSLELPEPINAMNSAGTIDEMLADDEKPEPAESPQSTHASTSMSVELPGSLDAGAIALLSNARFEQLELDFPFDVPLSIKEADAANWQIINARADEPIATIMSADDGLIMKWTEASAQSTISSALAHGRLKGDAESTIFLRPTIESDPWKVRVDEPDVMPTWDLRHPIPPRVARISVNFDLPEGIEEAWIEPIEPQSLRRGRGLAVLTPENGESVALGIRFDVRCSRKLSCRIRFAGRLDSSMPWQTVSVPLLEKFADQLTHQAMLVSKEAQRITSVHDMAGLQGRRIMKMKEKRNDELANQIRAASERTAQLQTLIASVEAEGTLKIRVWIDWPDAQQTVLSMDSAR